MTWHTLSRGFFFASQVVVNELRGLPPEQWEDTLRGEDEGSGTLNRQIITWIKTVRAANPDNPYYGPEWFPAETDYYKSALFERLRSGLKPLPEPPPLGYACPWYALVEDPGPHYVHDMDWDDIYGSYVMIYQNRYDIVERDGRDVILRDAHPETSYRFRLSYDANHVNRFLHRPGWPAPTPGAYMIRNMAFEAQA
jgi:hypothetical protein